MPRRNSSSARVTRHGARHSQATVKAAREALAVRKPLSGPGSNFDTKYPPFSNERHAQLDAALDTRWR